MIELIPFEFWSDLLGKNLKDTVSYLVKDKQFQVKIVDESEPIFLSAIIQNASTTKNQELLDALASIDLQDEGRSIVPLFSNAQFEKYITENKLWDDISLIKLRPKKTIESWSLAFTKKYTTELNKAIGNGQCYLDVQDGHYIATHFNMEAADHLGKVDSKCQGESWYHIWYNGVVKPISYRINIDHRLKNLVKS